MRFARNSLGTFWEFTRPWSDPDVRGFAELCIEHLPVYGINGKQWDIVAFALLDAKVTRKRVGARNQAPRAP